MATSCSQSGFSTCPTFRVPQTGSGPEFPQWRGKFPNSYIESSGRMASSQRQAGIRNVLSEYRQVVPVGVVLVV